MGDQYRRREMMSFFRAAFLLTFLVFPRAGRGKTFFCWIEKALSAETADASLNQITHVLGQAN